MVPVLYYELQNKMDLKNITKKLIHIGMVGVASLLIVLGIHFAQLTFYMGNISETVKYFSERTIERTGFQDTITYWDLFKNWWNIKFFYIPITSKYIASYLNVINEKFTIGAVHYVYFIIMSLTVILKQETVKLKNHQLTKNVHTLYNVGLATLFSLVASWSWFVNKGHMKPHDHMNGIMYIIPFGLCFFIFFGIFVQTLVQYLKIYLKNEVS
jgi:hypothetical protein